MLKFLLTLVVVIAALWWIGRRVRGALPPRPPPQRPRQLEAMVACAHCGLHLPQRDAVLREGLAYCSEAHALIGPGGEGR